MSSDQMIDYLFLNGESRKVYKQLFLLRWLAADQLADDITEQCFLLFMLWVPLRSWEELWFLSPRKCMAMWNSAHNSGMGRDLKQSWYPYLDLLCRIWASIN